MSVPSLARPSSSSCPLATEAVSEDAASQEDSDSFKDKDITENWDTLQNTREDWHFREDNKPKKGQKYLRR